MISVYMVNLRIIIRIRDEALSQDAVKVIWSIVIILRKGNCDISISIFIVFKDSFLYGSCSSVLAGYNTNKRNYTLLV